MGTSLPEECDRMAHKGLKLSPSQREAVERPSNVCVVSCPGSGKTRTIVAKLLACLEEVRGTARKVGCITYTNAGVYEIESRILELVGADDHAGYEVSTIHSFCLRHIVRPYAYLLPELRSGFAILSPEDEQFIEIMREVVDAHELGNVPLESFTGIQRLPDGDLFCSSDIGDAVAYDFLQRVADRGYRTLSDIVYYAARILELAPFVARSLGSAFAWILVDEFQDTSAVQVQILSRIADVGRTKFFLVGDPNQSIMGFAGARPDLMRDFAARIETGAPVPLAGNYRSSRRIVTLAERLCPTNPAMEAVGQNRDYEFDPFHVEAVSVEDAIINYFLPIVESQGISLGETAILARSWFTLYPLGKKLRREGVPIFGPGARPYRRRLVFAPFAEEVCAYLESRQAANVAGARRALFHLVEELTGKSEWTIFTYEGRVVLTRFLHEAARLRVVFQDAESWLREAVNAFERIMLPAGLLDAHHIGTIRDSAEEMIEGLQSDADLVAPVGVEHLGLFAAPRDCLRLLSLHASKGREFDAVALIDLHDGRIPDHRARGEKLEEERRLLYVGITRARKLLMLFTDQENWRPASRFLGPEGLDLL
jgi:DNA helicase-2/ATP-dependent DNA helicase PcrA